MKITIDGQPVECRPGIPVLQAALEAGWDVPHYCYHPSLSVVASCRLCLMEMMAPNPKTGELIWMPKLLPSCQTPVRDGLVVRFDSDKVRENQRSCMEFFLLNHPLDCPVCDQAGECYLQDYSYHFGNPTSRMVEQKIKNPKKDIGPRTLLYQDRCVMCTRCVRFTQEIAGTGELTVVNRGSLTEIDAFPGLPLDNKLQGNVVDICPVGALLDKDFLFKQRVWHLKGSNSVCAGCSTGCSIRVDHNDDVVYRLKPRYNPRVNGHWMCDEGRFGWKHVHSPNRLTWPIQRRGSEKTTPAWDQIPEILAYRFEQSAGPSGGQKAVFVLSPMMTCEEAWLVLKFMHTWAPQATVAIGPTPVVGQDEHFPAGCAADRAAFTIRNEKCPNRKGIELILARCGRPTLGMEAVIAGCKKGQFLSGWISGGYPDPGWIPSGLAEAASQLELLLVHDMFPSPLSAAAEVVLPFCAWTEREGCFINHAGLIQTFQRAVNPPDGARRDGQYLYDLAGFKGLYDPLHVRALMAEAIPEFREVYDPPPLPAHQH